METIEQRYRRYLENPDQMESEAQEVARIDPDDCFPQMLSQASNYVTWAQLATIADYQAEALRQHHDVLAAECRDKAHNVLLANGEKATDQRVKDVGLRDPALVKHNSLRRKAELFAQRLKCIQTALLQKKDMLIQIGFRQRAELGFYKHDNGPDLRTFADSQHSRKADLEELKEQAMNAMNR